MEIDGGCYGNKVWLCRYVGLTLIGMNRKDVLLTEITVEGWLRHFLSRTLGLWDSTLCLK